MREGQPCRARGGEGNPCNNIEAVLEELIPDSEYEIILELGSYYMDAADAEFSLVPHTDAGLQAFFFSANLAFMVNYWDFGIDPLMARQFSGVMADEYESTQWILNAETGKWGYYFSSSFLKISLDKVSQSVIII